MGFKKLRLAPITTLVGDDKYPEYGSFVKLQDTTTDIELNSVEIKLTPTTKTKAYEADDRRVEKRVVVGYEIALKVYDTQVSTAKDMFGYEQDANSNLIETVNSTDKKAYGVFFEGVTAKGVKYQKYLYHVEFDEPTFTATTDNGETAEAMEITGRGYLIDTGTELVKSATVYSDKSGWVTSEPQSMYKKAVAQQGGGGG